MVAHIVLLKPRPDLSSDDREQFVAAFERAIRTIPEVRGVRIGLRLRHDAGYEGTMPDADDFLAIIYFDDLDGLKRYLSHPAHEDLGLLFGQYLSAALVYDFEVGGLDLLQNVLARSIKG